MLRVVDESRLALPRFVIQQHDATRMHYDLRLEIGGVLVSWAVPRGPSLDPGTKRLAVFTTDHDLAYADHESEKVIVWDAGRYTNLTGTSKGDLLPMSVGLERGHLKFWLHGEKLEGAWALTHTGDQQWLLVKVKDVMADPLRDPVRDEPQSIRSGRTL